MGIDAVMFDERSKTYVYFDRMHNMNPNFVDGTTDEAHEIWDRARANHYLKVGVAPHTFITEAQAFQLCQEMRAGWAASDDPARSWWAIVVGRFVLAHPGGRYFIQTDHDSPEWWGIRDTGYTEWEAENPTTR